MKAITLWQPWATLLAVGCKHMETRSWSTKYRGEILIHASKKPYSQVRKILPTEDRRYIEDLLRINRINGQEHIPTGVIVGKAELMGCIKITESFRSGLANIRPEELILGDFTPGRYAWIIKRPVLFKEPIPAKGMQGLWNYDGEIKKLATTGSYAYTEILNLLKMLDKDGIQYEKERLYDGWRIGIPYVWPEHEIKYSIIEHAISCGHQHDLVELTKYDEDQNKLIYNIGSLTAKVAMEYIKGERE